MVDISGSPERIVAYPDHRFCIIGGVRYLWTNNKPCAGQSERDCSSPSLWCENVGCHSFAGAWIIETTVYGGGVLRASDFHIVERVAEDVCLCDKILLDGPIVPGAL